MKRDYYECDFPNWALTYLVNNDPSALSNEDKADADAFLDSLVIEGYDVVRSHVTDDVNGFCAHPAFGLACDTTKVRFYKRR